MRMCSCKTVKVCFHYIFPFHLIQVDQYIHRILVEEDIKGSQEKNEELFFASADAGEKLYKKGDFAASQISSTDIYLLKKVPKRHFLFVLILADLTKFLNFIAGWLVSRYSRT